MHIFLTGGTGIIGSAVLACALKEGHTVTALARTTETAAQLESRGAQALAGDITQPEKWVDHAASADCFIHLASSFDASMAQTDPLLIDQLATATRPRATPLRFLYTGGCWLFGATHNAIAHEESPLNSIAAFDWAAACIAQLKALPHLSTAILHPGMVYDGGGGVFSRYIRALRQGRPPSIWGDAKTRWPLVHRDDAAAAYVLLAGLADTGTFNVVTQQGVSQNDITDVLRDQAGIKAPAAVMPHKWVLSRHGRMGEGPMLDQQMSGARLLTLGWQPDYPDFSALHYEV